MKITKNKAFFVIFLILLFVCFFIFLQTRINPKFISHEWIFNRNITILKNDTVAFINDDFLPFDGKLHIDKNGTLNFYNNFDSRKLTGIVSKANKNSFVLIKDLNTKFEMILENDNILYIIEKHNNNNSSWNNYFTRGKKINSPIKSQ